MRIAVTKSSTEVAKLDRLAVNLFRVHWRGVNVKITGGIDVACMRAEFFLASSTRERLRLARRYYTPARVSKLSNASAKEILLLSDPWLGAFRNQIDQDSLDDPEIREQLRRLVAAEYVAVSCLSPDPVRRPRQVTNVSPLPDEAIAYGDVYELTASGFSCGSYLRICKSVTKAFRAWERREAILGIEREFFDSAADAGEVEDAWHIEFRNSMDSRVIEADIVEMDASKGWDCHGVGTDVMLNRHQMAEGRTDPSPSLEASTRVATWIMNSDFFDGIRHRGTFP